MPKKPSPHGRRLGVSNTNQAGKGDAPRPVSLQVYLENYEAIFRKKKKTRSSEQNRYYWGVVVRMVAEGFADLGNPISPDSDEDCATVHEYLKRRFLKPITAADANGEVHEIGYSTANLSTSEMMDYIAQIQQFAAEFLNVAIPAPGEQAEMNF